MAFEDPNSKLVEIVSVADVDDDKCFDDSFMQIWKLKFGPHGIRICIKRKKIDYGKFFDFWSEKCVYN